MTAPVSHFLDAAEDTGVGPGDREAWLELRRTMVTASDVAAIMGEDEYKSAVEVFVEKVTPPKDERLDITDPRFWGQRLEQPILEAFADFYDWDYQPGGRLLRSRKHPLIGATLDGEIDRTRTGAWEIGEGKTTRISRDWDEESGQLPKRFLIQTQTQLLVTLAPGALELALLQGSRPLQIPLDPAEALFPIIVEHVEWFMDLVARAEPPPPDASRSARRALEQLYPEQAGACVALPPKAVEWSREYVGLVEWAKAVQRRKDEIANLLRSSIGTATHGLLPEEVNGKRAWSWKSDSRGIRSLRQTKNLPHGIALFPTRTGTELERTLAESVEREATKTAPLKKKRRKARR